MQTNPADEQSKIVRLSESLWNQYSKGKGIWRKEFVEEPNFKFRMKY